MLTVNDSNRYSFLMDVDLYIVYLDQKTCDKRETFLLQSGPFVKEPNG